MSTYRLTLISLLAAVCVIGRIAFQFLPNIQPVTTIIIIAGVMLGILPAIFIAIITTYITNLFLGMGIWTIWQMAGWSLIAVIAGMIGKNKKFHHTLLLALFGFFSAYLYGLILSLGSFTVAGKFLPYYLASIPFDTLHGIGNIIFMILLYPVLSRIFTFRETPPSMK